MFVASSERHDLSPVSFSFLSGSKFGYECFCPFDIGFLSGLIASAKENDQAFPLLHQVDFVTWTPIYSIFAKAIEPLDVGCVT
ncbi:hypothetical protein D3C87_1789900 [compost metagenome]